MAPVDPLASESESPQTTIIIDPTDLTKPIVQIRTISAHFAGEALDRTKSNWKKWSISMRQSLSVSALGHHIDATRNRIPDESVRPTSYDNWFTNDLAVRVFIEMNCSEIEQEFLEKYPSALGCWNALQKAHLAEGPVKQMDLIRTAFTTRIPRDKDQDARVRQIMEDIRRAFDMPGGLSRDTLTCIALLSALGEGHDHLRAIIQWDIQNATDDKSFLPHHICSYITSDTQLLLGDACRTNTTSSAIALTAKPSPKGHTTVFCSNCKKPNHTEPYCISPGGGMAGKSIEESRTARRLHKLESTSRSATILPHKQKVRITTAAGQALMVEIDDATLANGTPAPKDDFAGILQVQSTDVLEWDAFDGFAHMASVEEEEESTTPATTNHSSPASPFTDLTTSINWDKASQMVDLATITVAALNQHSKTTLALNKFPFYVDSGASIYVTPDRSDFYTLKRIEPRQVGGVGTASVTAIGIGEIHLSIDLNTPRSPLHTGSYSPPHIS
jgi:hypothetical protein